MSDLGDKIFGKVSGDMDPITKILARIPGFSGYIDRENRRASDKLLRDTIFARYRELEGRVSTLQRDFINRGEIAWIDDLESIAIKLRTFADRVRVATRGYSGIFDAAKIGEDELTRLYEYDAALLDSVDQIGHAIDNVEASVGSDGLPAAIRNLDTLARQAVETFNRRDEIVLAAP